MPSKVGAQKAKKSIYLVQQGVWEMPLESMPLASGYMKATAMADDRIKESADIAICNFRGGATNAIMANALFENGAPDVLAFSVLGWNYRSFGELAATFRQLNPDGWVIFGGTHVSGQSARVFRMFPDVDVVVNGEGELTFRDLLVAYLAGVEKTELHSIPGLSFRDAGGSNVTNSDRDRIDDLDTIPSPILTGALDLCDSDGRFRYDVALMETNRGCPYKCAFCYWGGAVGQKVRAFSIDRLRRELELYGRLKVHTVVACDANFGLLPGDVDFVDALIDTRDRFGFPRALETSWAKNKSKTFYHIVKKMRDAGMRSSFTLALQSLSDSALMMMNRRNMKLNEWEDLATWLDQEGMDCYAELIWGAPGETVESFLQGYDRLARWTSRIAVYPVLLLPNTDFAERADEFGIRSVRGDTDDFEYVLTHSTMSFADNQRMQRFLFWARVVAENAVLRYSWLPLRMLAGLTQSEVLRNLQEWVSAVEDNAALSLRSLSEAAVGGTAAFGDAIAYFYCDPQARRLLERWWAESIRPVVPSGVVDVLDEVFRYDLLTQPVCQGNDLLDTGDAVPVVVIHGDEYFVRRGLEFQYDVPAIMTALRRGQQPDLSPSVRRVDLYYRTGAESAVTSTNHEVIVHYMGMTETEVVENALGRQKTELDGLQFAERGRVSGSAGT
jgi:hypothetical protein